ncbi:MAG: hypothetical protein JWQ87_4486 [Candidatus Sulfotelmatobacter sp.]|nr:hypothetical protein [Candidatus Sulfotelmatobacter sp.]
MWTEAGQVSAISYQLSAISKERPLMGEGCPRLRITRGWEGAGADI